MTVSDIQVWNLFEFVDEKVSLFRSTAPNYMSHTIIKSYITVTLSLWDLLNLSIDDLLVVPKAEENRLCTCILNVNEFCPVLLFLSKSVLMLFNAILFIVFVASETHDCFLGMTSHSLLVNVHRLFGIFNDVSLLDKTQKSIAALLVDFGIIWIQVSW